MHPPWEPVCSPTRWDIARSSRLPDALRSKKGSAAQVHKRSCHRRCGGGAQRLKMLPVLVDQAASSSFAEVDISPMDDVSFPLGITRRADPVRRTSRLSKGATTTARSACVVPHARARTDAGEGGHPCGSAARRRARTSRGSAARPDRESLPGQTTRDATSRSSSLRCTKCRASSGFDLRVPIPGTHERAAYRNGPGPPEGLQASAPAGAVGVHAGPRRNATSTHPGGCVELVGRIRDVIPEVALSTDMIVGFPGETAADFEQTLSLVEAVRYRHVFVQLTPAAEHACIAADAE